MRRDLKIHIDPGDIRVPEETDFSADDHVKELITQALVFGESGGRAFGLLIATMGTFAGLSDKPVTLLKVALDCLAADLAHHENQVVVDLVEELPSIGPIGPPAEWKDRVLDECDAIDQKRDVPPPMETFDQVETQDLTEEP